MTQITSILPAPRLVRSASIVMFFFVTSRALGLLRDVVISHQFGTTRQLDAYMAAFSITDLVFNVIAGGALGSAFIPVFSSRLAHGEKAAAWKLASAITNIALVVLVIVALVLAFFAPEVAAATVATGFDALDKMLVANLMRWMLITPVVFGVSGIVMGILNSYQHFALPAFAPVLYNLAIIAGALFLAPAMGIYGLVAGVVAGSFLHLSVQLPWLIRQGIKYSPRFDLSNPDVWEVGRLMLPRTAGLAAVQVNFLVNTILASTLATGSIAALGYAWRVMLLPEGVIALSLATAVFPTLSQQIAREQAHEFSQTLSNAFRTTLYFTVPAALGLILLATPTLGLLFQRGEFTIYSTELTAVALRFYAIGLFAHSGLEILTRGFYALHDTKTPVTLAVLSVGLNILLSLTLVGPLGHGGLALANSVATILEMFVLWLVLKRRIKGGVAEGVTGSIARILAGTAGMALVLLLFLNLTRDNGFIIVAPLGIFIGALVYLVVTLALGSKELDPLLGRLRRATN